MIPFGLGQGDRATCSPVCFGLGDGLGDELDTSAFVNGKWTVDMTFEGVENARSCNDGFKLRVADTS